MENYDEKLAQKHKQTVWFLRDLIQMLKDEQKYGKVTINHQTDEVVGDLSLKTVTSITVRL